MIFEWVGVKVTNILYFSTENIANICLLRCGMKINMLGNFISQILSIECQPMRSKFFYYKKVLILLIKNKTLERNEKKAKKLSAKDELRFRIKQVCVLHGERSHFIDSE